jgi:hypothetical protein
MSDNPQQSDAGLQEAAAAGNQEAAMQPPSDQTDTPEGMVRVQIVQNFRLVRDDHTTQEFTERGTNCGLPGFYDVTPEDANHWFLQAHSANPPEPLPPMAGTARAAEIEQRKNHRRRLAEMAADQEEQNAATEVRRDRQNRVRRALGPTGGDFEQAP